MSIRIEYCKLSDFEGLQKIGLETYDDTFRSMNKPETIDSYLEEAFSLPRLKSELKNPDSEFYFLYSGNKLAGYLKINFGSAQTDLKNANSLEVERIYVRKKFKGKGLGRNLLEFAIQKAVEKKKDYVWLGVWEKNESAIAFYTKMGFNKSGSHTFRMGDEIQNDLIMKKNTKSIERSQSI